MRECSDEVRLGMTSELSWSRVWGRSRVDGRAKEAVSEGAIFVDLVVLEFLGDSCRGTKSSVRNSVDIYEATG